jgi:hypothetical protein
MLKDRAKKMVKAIEQKTRDNGEKFYCLKDKAPKWMTGVCCAAHENGAILPDDYRYQFIVDALEIIAEGGTSDEAQEGFDNWESDIYTNSLTAWLHSRCDRVEYLTQAIGDGSKDGCGALSYAQCLEFQETAQAVLSALEALEV